MDGYIININDRLSRQAVFSKAFDSILLWLYRVFLEGRWIKISFKWGCRSIKFGKLWSNINLPSAKPFTLAVSRPGFYWTVKWRLLGRRTRISELSAAVHFTSFHAEQIRTEMAFNSDSARRPGAEELVRRSVEILAEPPSQSVAPAERTRLHRLDGRGVLAL